jgi:hypothetical protein
METVAEVVRRAQTNYRAGSVKLGDYVDFDMRFTIEKIYAYLNSKQISGDTDSLKRKKPFFNIVRAAVNIWYRATDLDRKDIKFVPTTNSSVILAFVANVMLQNWMNHAKFGQFLNKWGRTMAEYGGAISKFVERGGKLIALVIPWSRSIPDPIDFNALPSIELFYRTKEQLQNMATPGHPDYAHYEKDQVDKLVDAAEKARETSGGSPQDSDARFIELFEVHGYFDSRLLLKDPNENSDATPNFTNQIHIVSVVQGEKEDWQDFELYKGPEAKNPVRKDSLIDEEGRTLPIGAVETLFDAQFMANHSMKAWKDNMDLASKLIFQTADENFTSRNLLSAVEQGEVLTYNKEKGPLAKVPTDSYDLSNIRLFLQQWLMIGNEQAATPDVIKGNTLPSGTPFSLASYMGTQANSLFELMTENKALALEDMMREFVIPYLRKQLKNKDQVAAILDDSGVHEIDAMYIPKQAVRNYNKRTKEKVLFGLPVQPYDAISEEAAVKNGLSSLGNKRFFTPDELGQKQWDELFSDFEWDNIRVEIVNENTDKQVVLQTLATVLQTIATNPAVLQDENARMVFSQILNETGRLSPLQFIPTPKSTVPTVPSPQGTPGDVSKIADLSKTPAA